jgi:L-ascorbate metabolism protein UlaG (beta-lactamase superfamily)
VTTTATPPLTLADDAESPDVDSGEITFIGTATVLLRYAGFTIVTDPNFLHRGEHAYIGLGLRTRRLTQPAMSIAELPPIDFVVLSHHHGDHFDQRSAAELDKDLPIITEPHGARKLTSQGFRRPIALSTWQTQAVVRGDVAVRVTALPGKHAPQPLGSLIPPVMGSMLEFSRRGEVQLRCYVTGDTLLHDGIDEIARRYPDIDLGLLHLGGTRVAGILLTMNADQGIRLLQIVRPRAAIPIHYNDYTVFKEPREVFERAVAAASLATEVHYLDHGDTHRFEVKALRRQG